MSRKVAVITGASRGIGRACAMELASHGYEVVINFVQNEAAAMETVEAIKASGGSAYPFRADVADAEEASALIKFSLSLTGRIDVLVNNAAISVVGLFTDITADTEKRLFDVNLMGTLNCTKAVLPYMIREQSGAIVNVSSMWGQVGASCEVHYSTAKAAIIGFTKALAKEVAPSGIRVNCVAPGVIDTEMNAHLSPDDLQTLADEIPMGRLGSPAEVAECVRFLCDSASYVTGQVISPTGGYIT